MHLPIHPLTGADADLDPLLARVGDRRLVLLGEASHGTHEFYAARARITRRLIEEKGFVGVAVEADWPDAARVDRWVRGVDGGDVHDALGGFRRFPTWMWRNTVVRDLARWMRARNDGLPRERQAGFYGIDLYSLHASIGEVIAYLDRADPAAAAQARERYACFEHFGADPQRYGSAASFDAARSCEDAVVRQLVDLRTAAPRTDDPDGHFHAEQNARLVRNAERYYRAMFRSSVGSWNLRDTHMADTLDALCDHLGRPGSPAKLVVWAHNSHLGDARATELGAMGELNVGQLARERHGDDAVLLVGFSTHAGTVTAAHDWDEPAGYMSVNPSLPGSVERLLHDAGTAAGTPNFLIDCAAPGADPLAEERLTRAIGVIYRPRTERQSHYFGARTATQFDVVLHYDETTAVHPLDPPQRWPGAEPPETFPSGL